jgi:DNA-binding NarL/FixJ family response regulator
MAVKELDWPGRTMEIKIIGGSKSLNCDGFRITLRELEVLNLRAKGLTKREIALKLSISYHTSRRHFDKLKERNAEGDEAPLPTNQELINRAEELGLLNPYAIKGLESILERI